MNNNQTFILFTSFFGFLVYVGRAIVVAQIKNNEQYDGDMDNVGDFTTVTLDFLDFTLIACILGGASTFFGVFHATEWTQISRMAAFALATVAMFAEFVPVGYSAKQWQLDTKSGDDLNGRLHFLGVASLVQVVTQFMLVYMLWTMKVETEPTTGNAAGTTPEPAGKHDSDTDEHGADHA